MGVGVGVGVAVELVDGTGVGVKAETKRFLNETDPRLSLLVKPIKGAM